MLALVYSPGPSGNSTNCIINDLTACDNNKQIRTRTRKEATNGGIVCTPAQNALPLTETCNDCKVSDWTVCDGPTQTRTRTRKEATNGGIDCTPAQNALPLSETCNDCEVSGWTPCNNNQRIRTRTRKQATNGGIDCTPAQNALPISETCNDCEVSAWIPTPCNGPTQTRTVTQATNGGKECTAEQNIKSLACPASIQNPHGSFPGCSLGAWSTCINSVQSRSVAGDACSSGTYRLPSAQTCSSPDTFVTVYTEPNYEGTGVKLFPPSYYNMMTLKVLGSGENIISSIKVPPGLKATVYHDNHYQGYSIVLTSDVPDLSKTCIKDSNNNDVCFNDVISSIRIQLI